MIKCAECGEENPDDAVQCSVCDRPIGAGAVQRQGDRLVVHRGGTLPPFCVKCGAPAREKPIKVSFYWHHPAIYMCVLMGFLPYAVVALIVRKRWDLAVPLCERHFRRRASLRWTALGVFVGGVVLAFGSAATRSDTLQAFGCIGAAVGTIAALILLAVAQQTLQPKLITDDLAEFAGASPAFLAVLGA